MKEMATHSSILAWEIPWTEEPSRLESVGLRKKKTKKRVGYNLAAKQQHFLFVCLFVSFIFISWRLITLQYCSGFCHTLT